MIRKLKYLIIFFFLITSVGARAQEVRKLSLQEAVELGLKNSKNLKLAQSKVDLALNRFKQMEEQRLPSASAGMMYNHAEFLSKQFRLPGNSETLQLPSNANAFIGSVSVEQLVFAGNKLRYAKESTTLLSNIARLDAEKDSSDITYNIINSYYNLYRLQQSQKIVAQNLESVDRQLQQAQKFFEQGIVTKNDVLRYQLQRSNIELTGIDLQTNRQVVNYNFNIMLGLSPNIQVQVDEMPAIANPTNTAAFFDSALANRTELRALEIQYHVGQSNVKSVKADMLPTVGVGGNLYFINPTGKFIPPAQSFLAPVAIAANLSWSIDKLWTNKTKVAEAKIQQEEVTINKEIAIDNIKSEVNKNVQDYQKAMQRIQVLQVAVEQARENDRIMESKYRNNIASVTDRIDAETQLFQTLINLEISKADAGLAYYTLLKSTGTITNAK